MLDQKKEERINLLKENLRLDHLNPEEKMSILEMCMEFNDIFYLPNDKLTTTSTVRHGITVSNPAPIHSKIYRYPEVHKTEVEKQLKKCLNKALSNHLCLPIQALFG